MIARLAVDFVIAPGVPEVMVVSITRGQNGFAGAFQVRDGEATNKREVHGADCCGAANVGQIAAERADGTRVFSSSPTWTAEALLGVGYHPRWRQ